MRHLLVSGLLLLNSLLFAAEIQNVSPMAAEIGGASTNAIQRLVLDPMKVLRIPVAMDRLTTIRFPSPPSDLASALVATEVHPAALFLLSFQPGASFFSLRALSAGASTTLNVVWKSQTYVIELEEARTPWLSVVLIPPEPPRPVRDTRTDPPEARPGSQFLETAKAYFALKRKYPNSMPEVQLLNLNIKREMGAYSFRTDHLFYFPSDDVLVLRMNISNRSSVPLALGTNALGVVINNRPAPVILTDFDGSVPGGAEVVTFIVFPRGAPPDRKSGVQKDTIGVSLNAPIPGVVVQPRSPMVIPLDPPQAAGSSLHDFKSSSFKSRF